MLRATRFGRLRSLLFDGLIGAGVAVLASLSTPATVGSAWPGGHRRQVAFSCST